MLFKQKYLQGIAAGAVTCAYRKWKRPTVKSGGTLRTAAGVLRIQDVSPITEAQIQEKDAQAAGYASLAHLLDELRTHTEGDLYRIKFKLESDDPRIALSQNAHITPEELAQLVAKLEKLDKGAPKPWTMAVLSHLAQHPGARAIEIAQLLQLDKPWLKTNIRKLKEHGLTISLVSGYELSPRGHRLLEML